MDRELDSLLVDIEMLLASTSVVDEAEISEFTSESQYVSVAVDQFEDIRKITLLLGASLRTDECGNPRPMTRDEAILGGLLARVGKLQTGFIDQICQNRQETAIILKRCLVETLVDLAFLLKNNSKSFFDGFIKYSLSRITRLQRDVESAIEKRSNSLPIEDRILESIRRMHRKAGFSEEDIKKHGYSPWPKKVLDRFYDVFGNSNNAYLTFISGLSNAVHGNWEDIVRYHMKFCEGHWYPKLDWAVPRPQLITTASLISAHVIALYADDLIPNCHDKQELLSFLHNNFPKRVKKLDSLHEYFIQRELSGLPDDEWDEH